MINKLFGTNGIRGLYKDQITPELAFELGKAVGIVFKRQDEVDKVIVGRDSRRTSDVLKNALVAGINSMGTNVVEIGVVPTALVPFSIIKEKANAGIMVTASSSLSEYAGFKIFNGNGYVISKEQESHIEYLINNPDNYAISNFKDVGISYFNNFIENEYVNHLRKKICFSNLKLLINTSKGAVCSVAKKIFEDTNNTVAFINGETDFFVEDNNSNYEMKRLAKKVVENQFDYGISLSPDGGRVLVVDSSGNIISGEMLMYFFALKSSQKEVVTSMQSNMGLDYSLKQLGVKTHICEVGENNVLNELLKNNLTFGGEKNGRLMFMEESTTSDGLLTAIKFLNLAKDENIIKYCENYIPYYQINVNFSAKTGVDLEKDEKLKNVIQIAEGMLYETGRILFRKSGTENIYRLLVEGYKINEVENIKKEIINVISNTSL